MDREFDWEDQQFQEWEDREFEDAINNDLSVNRNVEDHLEFAVRELIESLRNLIRVVEENADTYERIVPNTMHKAIISLVNEITDWDWRK